MERCKLCEKEGEDIGLAECANCGTWVCEDCYHAQGGGAFGAMFPICRDCQKVLTVCGECGNYAPDEFVSMCPGCKKMVCQDCSEGGMHECDEP